MSLKTAILLLLGASLFIMSEASARTLLKNGNLNGILVSKGEFWIEVKDDNGYSERYLAPWRGLGPTRGGGFDSASLNRFKDLVVGNRVSMKWSWDGHLRVHEIEVIRPSREKGMFEGYLLEIGDRWIDVQNSDEKIPWRFYLPWVGGYPENGGGFDQSVIEPLREHQPTNPILFEWNYQLRPRIVKLVTREEITFKPFYELDEVPPWLGPPGGNKTMFEPKPVNPFDIIQGKSVNPFDVVAPQGKGTNPFDSVGGKPASSNPFDSAPSGGGVINPFEQTPPPSKNPFDSAPPNLNPFDQAPPNTKPAAPNPFDSAPPPVKPVNPFDEKVPAGNPFDSVNP